jgi:hypothetical protein
MRMTDHPSNHLSSYSYGDLKSIEMGGTWRSHPALTFDAAAHAPPEGAATPARRSETPAPHPKAPAPGRLLPGSWPRGAHVSLPPGEAAPVELLQDWDRVFARHL